MDIDVVYTWVDGADPEFAALKQRYAPPHMESNVPSRYRDNNELRYSLRSVAAFAPWVRRIHIVTHGHVPKWLNVDHPKIRMVTHEQIFAWPQHLPCFNSHAIECHLSRIPDLAEHLLYFNDDFFLGAPVQPETFFDADGTMCLNKTGIKLLPEWYYHPSEPLIFAAAKNAVSLLWKKFGDEPDYIWSGHQAVPLTKRFMQETESAFAEALERCSASRFRSVDDVALCLVLWNNYAHLTQAGRYREISHMSVEIHDDVQRNRTELAGILAARPLLFCLHDHTQTVDPAPPEPLAEFFEAYFPQPSPFERA